MAIKLMQSLSVLLGYAIAFQAIVTLHHLGMLPAIAVVSLILIVTAVSGGGWFVAFPQKPVRENPYPYILLVCGLLGMVLGISY